MNFKRFLCSAIVATTMFTSGMAMMPSMQTLAGMICFSEENYETSHMNNKLYVSDDQAEELVEKNRNNSEYDFGLECDTFDTTNTNVKDISPSSKASSLETIDIASDLNIKSYATLPNHAFIDNSPCFPPIAAQKNQSSCIAFATTYYQFSYEVNKLNNVTSTSDRVIYSPKWTYNFLNCGRNEGLKYEDAYNLLKSIGALKNSDFKYTGTNEESDYTQWPTGLETQKANALETRVVSKGILDIPSSANISSPNDPALNEVKAYLNEHKALTVATNCNFISGMHGNEPIIYRCMETEKVFNENGNPVYGENGKQLTLGGAHALTIVGYDDRIWFDVNKNTKKEPCECGAFKIANSWGKNFKNMHGLNSTTGYMWIMYDALNASSTNNYNDWESECHGVRRPIFNDPSKQNTVDNQFNYIMVDHMKVNVIGKLKANVSNKYELALSKYISSDTNPNMSINSSFVYPFSGGLAAKIFAFNGTILFDYSDIANPINNYYKNYNWGIMASACSANDSFSITLLDNRLKVLASEKNIGANKSGYHDLDYIKGNLNYDKKNIINEEDVDILLQYNLNKYELSNYQYCLADINNDGVVDLADLTELYRKTSSPKMKKYINNAISTYYAMMKIKMSEVK